MNTGSPVIRSDKASAGHVEPQDKNRARSFSPEPKMQKRRGSFDPSNTIEPIAPTFRNKKVGFKTTPG